MLVFSPARSPCPSVAAHAAFLTTGTRRDFFPALAVDRSSWGPAEAPRSKSGPTAHLRTWCPGENISLYRRRREEKTKGQRGRGARTPVRNLKIISTLRRATILKSDSRTARAFDRSLRGIAGFLFLRYLRTSETRTENRLFRTGRAFSLRKQSRHRLN